MVQGEGTIDKEKPLRDTRGRQSSLYVDRAQGVGCVNIPKKLKIGGHQYEVIFPYTFTERFDMAGDHDGDTKCIRISALDGGNMRRADSAMAVTFIHEVLHAIDDMSGHDMFLGNDGEKRIEAISEGIYQVIVDNPQLFEIMKPIKENQSVVLIEDQLEESLKNGCANLGSLAESVILEVHKLRKEVKFLKELTKF